MEWYLKVIKNYANFSGRARRKEYWMFVLFNIIISIVIGIIDSVLGLQYGSGMNQSGILGTVYSLFVFIPSLAVSVRRLHDINKPGWLLAVLYGVIIAGYFIIFTTSSSIVLMISALAMLGLGIYAIVLFATNGDVGENQYGPDPKDENAKASNDDILDDTI